MSVFSSAWSVAVEVIYLQQKWRQKNIVSDRGSIDRWVLTTANNDGDNIDKNHIEKGSRG